MAEGQDQDQRQEGCVRLRPPLMLYEIGVKKFSVG